MYTILLFIPPLCKLSWPSDLSSFTLPPSASSRSPLSLLATGRTILNNGRLSVGYGSTQHSEGTQSRSGSLLAGLSWPGTEDGSPGPLKMSPKEQDRAVLWWQPSNRSHLFYNCSFSELSPAWNKIFSVPLFFTLSKIIQCPPSPLGKSKVDMATFWTQAVKVPFLCSKTLPDFERSYW